MAEKNIPETKISKNQNAFLLLALALLAVIRTVPALKAPLSVYGYDFGFYYYAAAHGGFHLRDFWQIIFGGYNSFLFLAGHWLRLPPEIIVVGSYFLASIFLGWTLYLLMGYFGKTTGIFAVLLLACSLFQAEAYSMFLWKNILAVPFLVLAFTYLMRSRWKPFIICALAVLLFHRTTAIILILCCGFYFIFQLIKTKRYKLLAALIMASAVVLTAAYLLLPIKSIILNLIDNNNYDVRTGLFLQNQNLFALWWPYLALGAAGLILYIKNKENALLPIFAGVNIVWIIFQLPFYRRTLIYLDLGVICFAAYFLGQINYSRKMLKAPLAVIIVFLAYRSAQYILAEQPLIYPEQVSEIKNFNAPSGFVLAVSADDAPWLDAYIHNQRLGAPGLLEDPHTYQEWQNFWQGQNQRQFISYYPRPLYIYERSWQLPKFGVSSCLIQLSENFYQVDYGCIEKTLP